MPKIKLCLACSPGGHLLQMMELRSIYKKYPHFFLTFKRKMTEDLTREEKVVFIEDTERSPLRLLKNTIQSFSVFLRERPNVIIANGGGFTTPFCYIAKLFRRRIIFIESFSRVDHPSISGRVLHPISDLFIVQWKPLMKYYKKAVYGGSIF